MFFFVPESSREKFQIDLICLGGGIDIRLYKENNKTLSSCYQDNNNFDYHGISNALCGWQYPHNFTPKRFTVIQMV